MPSVNPNPKRSIKEQLSARKKPLTFESFNFDTYKDEARAMEEFRKQAHGEAVEELWNNIEKRYLPSTISELRTYAQYDLDTDGNATPTRFFAENDNDGLIDHHEPLIAVKLHTGLALMTQRTPDVVWDSDNELYASRVPVLSALRKEDWMDDQTRQQYVMMWFYNIMFGTTFWRRFYDSYTRPVKYLESINLDSGEEVYRDGEITEIDQTVGEALSPLDVWIDPATVPAKPRSMRKVMYEKVYDFDTFYRLFKDEAKPEFFNKVEPTSIPGYEGEHWVKCRYYEDINLDLYYVVANDDFPLLKQRLPWNHKGLSVRMATWMPRGRKNPYGLGPIEMMGPDQKLLEDLVNMTMNQMLFSIYKSMIHQGSLTMDGQEGEDIRLAPNKIYKSTDPKAIAFIDVPGPGRESWQAIETQRARTDEASGFNKPLGGELSKTTAFEIDVAKDAALARLATPIASVVQLLRWDAEVIFELQKQFYTLPRITELTDPDLIASAIAELEKVNQAIVMDPKAPKAKFDIWFDETDEENPRVFQGDYRTTQVSLQDMPSGESVAGLGKQEAVLTADVYDWRGKIHVVADSLLSITPSLERTKKLEGYNILIPMFVKPPELMAKPARSLAKLYGLNVEDLFPEHWLQFLKQVDSGEVQPQVPENPVGRPPNAQGGIEDALGPAGFEQERAEQVVTNVGGQNSLAASQTANLMQTRNQQ